jgi:hypothetical protein
MLVGRPVGTDEGIHYGTAIDVASLGCRYNDRQAPTPAPPQWQQVPPANQSYEVQLKVEGV